MKSYYDFSEPMPKLDRHRKMEYAEEKEKFVTTSKYVSLPEAREVLERSKRKPRDDKPSQFVIDHMEKLEGKAPKSSDLKNSVPSTRGMSERANNARNEIFKKLGILR